MKRFVILIVLALVLMVSTQVFAETQLGDNKYVITNTGHTSQVTVIPTTTIVPATDRIISFSVTTANLPKGSSAVEAIAALYDASSLKYALNTALEGEIESNDSDTIIKTYARPLRIFNAVTIIQGAHTVVEIEWERHL